MKYFVDQGLVGRVETPRVWGELKHVSTCPTIGFIGITTEAAVCVSLYYVV